MDETAKAVKLYTKKLVDINYHIYGSSKYIAKKGAQKLQKI